MNLTSLKIFLCRNDVKIVIICTVTGGILQVLAQQYIKSHPEFLMDPQNPHLTKPLLSTRKRDRLRRFFSFRGGALIQISGISIKSMINFLAKKGLVAGLLSGGAIIIRKIPLTAVIPYLSDASVQNLSYLDKKKYILVENNKIYLDQCDQNLKYLFHILEDETIPFEEKKATAESILTKYLNLKTPFGRLNFVLCIVSIIYIFFINHHSNFYIMVRSLIETIREGKITKPMARLIIRQLRRQGVPIDPELAELAES